MNKYRLQDISGVYGGGTPDTKNTSYWNGSIPWITPKDMSLDNSLFIDSGERYITEDGVAKSSAKLLPKGSVIFSSRAPIGYCSIAERPLTTSQGCKGIICNENLIDNVYLCYVLKMAKHQLNAMSVGSTFREISTNELKDVVIHIPNIDRQRAISTLLVSIERNINICDQFRVYLKKIIRLIYDYWFVQFDFPDENGRPYKSSGGKMVYNEKLKREIPEGWKVRNITDVASWTSGAQPPKSQHIHRPAKGYVRFIQNRDYSPSNQYRSYIPISRSNKVCDELDIMIDKYGDAGRTRYGQSGAFNVALAKISPISSSISKEYLRSALSSDEIYNFLHESCMASTRASLNAELLGNVAIPIPGNEVMRHYENIAAPVISESLVLSKQSQQLAELRDWLLPMLMNGQIKFGEDSHENQQ